MPKPTYEPYITACLEAEARLDKAIATFSVRMEDTGARSETALALLKRATQAAYVARIALEDLHTEDILEA